MEYIFGRDAKPKFLADLLPERFGPADLQVGQGVPAGASQGACSWHVARL